MNNLIKLISSLKNFVRRRIVLISIENFNREFVGKEILSKYLAEEGYLVLLAHKSIIRVLVSYLPLKDQIYIEKGNRFGSYKYLSKAKKNKLNIYSFDEEGLMQTDFDTFLKRNHDKKTLEIIDGIFSWGPTHSSLLRKSGYKEKQILKTGNTRFDHYVNLIKNKPNEDYSKNEIILICSRFASANPNKKIKSNKDKRDGSDKYIEDSKKILNLMIPLPNIIREAKIKNKIIVRPHPSESKNLWIKACKGLDNVIVTCDEPINDVLLRTSYLIHNRCTTAIEAYLSNINVISYEPITLPSPPHPDKEFTNAFANYVCKSNSEILDCLKLNNQKKQYKYNKKIDRFIYNLNELSSLKIVKILSKRHKYIINNNLILVILIIFSLPIVVFHHKLYKIFYKLFRVKYYNYLKQKNGKIKSNSFLKINKEFIQLGLFSRITMFIPK